MILKEDESQVFTFPELHDEAEVTISLKRTLRIPEDVLNDLPPEKGDALPPGMGRFPQRRVEEFASQLPSSWVEHGGIIIPMHRSEAMWLLFETGSVEDTEGWPFAIKIAAGPINAVNGKPWTDSLSPEEGDYMAVPTQQWGDALFFSNCCLKEDTIRHFVAMSQDEGFEEEAISEETAVGVLQIAIFPMKKEAFEQRRESYDNDFLFLKKEPHPDLSNGMRIAEEGEEPYAFSEWEEKPAARFFVHIVNARQWRAITGEEPPTVPFTAGDYARYGLPWPEGHPAR